MAKKEKLLPPHDSEYGFNNLAKLRRQEALGRYYKQEMKNVAKYGTKKKVKKSVPSYVSPMKKYGKKK